ncbi:transferrin-binding protein-like solute binding protein [Neptunomonas japonica]|uniref:Transferrin-binding protein B C-lobe/N-lobe beta-barrel domain-containing protein n=1 Tax=Neptunomonas japonica JAMM 1380 TaxID=1441457 RepID=A0A7R6SUA5_9GAMM|nr:transferrin-binding protein-like solute binding protein [Neptunomonas japonica]BBB28126.1 conserved hypothetical protein [Neptunomonas japonica JAMM 1380]
MEKLSATIVCISTALLLTGCGGGGSSSVKAGYTSFSSIPANTKVDVVGRSVETSYVSGAATTDPVTGVTDLGTDTTMTTSLTYDSAGQLTRLSIATDNGTLTWNSSVDMFISDPGVSQVFTADRNNYAFIAHAVDLGFDYQTFGVWVTGLVTTSGRVGASSIGMRTNGAAVPTSGAASFTGGAVGSYIDASGERFVVVSESLINADFSSRSLIFTTSNSEAISLISAIDTSRPDLNLSGTLAYTAGSNSFSGSVSTVSALSGSASGHFYGPAAQEAGGVFAVTGSGVEGYRGSFGTVR